MHSGLVVATGVMLRHCNSDIKAEVTMNYAPCGLQRRGWILMMIALCKMGWDLMEESLG
jgi:hypothetical protein